MIVFSNVESTVVLEVDHAKYLHNIMKPLTGNLLMKATSALFRVQTSLQS